MSGISEFTWPLLVSCANFFQHRTQPMRYFCSTCNMAICQECIQMDHQAPQHQYEPIGNVAEKQMSIMESLVHEASVKQSELQDMFKVSLIFLKRVEKNWGIRLVIFRVIDLSLLCHLTDVRCSNYLLVAWHCFFFRCWMQHKAACRFHSIERSRMLTIPRRY